MDGGEDRTFKANFTGEGVTMLQDRVKEKLRELMGDYDDTLAEYVVVLLRNGRRKDGAAKELQVFLGDDNDAFVSWLWDHLSSNLHLYVQPKAASSKDDARSTRSAARGLPVHSVTSSIQEPEAQKTAITHQKRDWGNQRSDWGTIGQGQSEAVPLRSVVANVSHAEEKDFHEPHADERAFHESHSVRRTRSPDMHNHRKRSRDADVRSTKEADNTHFEAEIQKLWKEMRKKRKAKSFSGTKNAVIKIIELCYENEAWKMLNEQIVLLSKKQRNEVISGMIEKAQEYIDLTPDIDTRIELIKTLIRVCPKNFKGHKKDLTKRQAEEMGQTDEDADLMQEEDFDMTLESLTEFEKERRRDGDVDGTRIAVIDIVEHCYKAGAWEVLNDQIDLLAKSSGQFKQVIAAMVEKTMTYIDSIPENEARMVLIKTLISVCGIETFRQQRARLLETFAKMTKEVGPINDAVALLQESAREVLSIGVEEENERILNLLELTEAELESSKEVSKKLMLEKDLLEQKVRKLEKFRNEEVSQEANRVKEELRKEAEDRDHSVVQLNSLNAELGNCKEQIGKTSKECESLRTKVSELEEARKIEQEQILALQKQLAVSTEELELAHVTATEAKTGYEEQKEKMKYLEERLAQAESQLSQAESKLSQAESQIVEGDELRKKLHNTILELKGNIRVFCRVRPLLQFDGDSNGPEGADIIFPTSLESAGRGIDLIHEGRTHSFLYDKVFDHAASQEHVFVEISQLVQSALDGYKVCIFAYGQTGSGKTYTMIGNPGIHEKGVIPRSLDQVFKTSQLLQSKGWNYSMQASMLEIYNETIRDLLAPGRSNVVTIKHDHNGMTMLDLTIIPVSGSAQVISLLEKASHSRSVGKTQMNEQSSRSHFVCKLEISGSNQKTGQHVQGVLNLIDLAGSERVAKSGSTGDCLKETTSINTSLLFLGEVISAIANGDAFIPFRRSKLTQVLEPCLGGNSKALMFINIAPEASSVGETLCSLKFGLRVTACEIGIASPRQKQARVKQPRRL